ncbi:VOC family protein [Chloroflexota bacterium]
MSDKQNNIDMVTRVERINPYVNVADISTSLRYYVDVLGFDQYVETPNLGIVENDEHQIHMRLREDEKGSNRIWIGVENIEFLYKQYKINGAIINQEPTNYSWAYQMIIEDLDGNLLIYGSGPKDDLPFQD